MKNLKKSLYLILWLILSSSIYAQDAPITEAGIFNPPGPSAIIPMTVNNFNDIGAISLTMNYDPNIAIATIVTPNSLLGGAFTYNTSTAGTIIFSWYSNTGVSLINGSELFSIAFSRVTVGTTALSWMDNGTSCEYAKFNNGNYSVLNDNPNSSFYIAGELTFVADAPHTTAPDIVACANSIVHVPITVTDFNNIGAISLTLDYNPTSLVLQGFTANSGLPGNFTVQSSVAGRLVVSGYETTGGTGISLANNAVLCTIEFLYNGGNSDLTWYDDGISCEYTNVAPDYTPLYDLPLEDYYFHGSITEHPRPTVSISGTTTIINGQSADITFNMTGTSPWTLTYTDGVTPVTVPNIYTNPLLINVHPTVTTTYNVTSFSDAVCSALPINISGSAIITVNEHPIDIIIQKNSNCGEFSVKLRPTVNVNSNLTKIIFTVKWAATSGSDVQLNDIITLWPGLQQTGNRVLFGGYYYVTFSSLTTYAVNWLANSENTIMTFHNTGTGDGIGDFTIIPSDYNTVAPGLNTAYYIEQATANATGSIVNNANGASLNCGLYLKDFLQGPYNTTSHQMNTTLANLNYIPLAHPYNTTPWLYTGTEHISSYPTGVVDWVLVELRTGSAANTSVARRAGLLKRDGSLMDTNGTSPLIFHSIIPGNSYYVVVHHRNHLPIMTRSPIALPNTFSSIVDFTSTPSTNVYSTTNEAVILLETGVYGQIAGDLNADNRLKYSGSGSDRALIISKINSIYTPPPATLNSTISGYYIEDINMNGVVKYTAQLNDQAIIFANIDALTNPTTLNTVYQGQVPVSYTAKSPGLISKQIISFGNLYLNNLNK